MRQNMFKTGERYAFAQYKGMVIKMKYKIERKNWGRFFTVPCKIVTEHIKLCSGDFLKVLLYILSSDKNEIVSEDISDAAGISTDIVDDAVVYWSQAEIFSVLNVTVLKNKETNRVHTSNNSNTSDIASEASEKISILPAENPSDKSLEKKSHVKYSSKDVADIVNSQKEIKEMFSQLEVILKRSLRFSEQCGYINLVENYGFPVASILMLVQYCEDIGKASIRYVESIAESWFEQDITSYRQVEAEIIKLMKSHNVQNKVAKLFGITTNLTKKQKEYINSWTELGFDTDMIHLAYEKCVDQINKLSFPYINKIITSWSSEKIFTADEVNIYDAKAKKNKIKKKEKEHSYDLDEFYEFTINHVPKIKGKDKNNNE